MAEVMRGLSLTLALGLALTRVSALTASNAAGSACGLCTRCRAGARKVAASKAVPCCGWPQVLAGRIEDALKRDLPLDGLSGDKHTLPPHMKCVPSPAGRQEDVSCSID